MDNNKTYNLVEITLEALKKRLNDENMLLVQTEHGYCELVKFSFLESASKEDIDNFEKTYNLIIPWDYKEFLLRHNGATLFVHPHYGGGIELFGIKQIIKMYIDYDYINMIPKGWYPIGTDNGSILFVNSHENSGRITSYLYWNETLSIDDAIKLDMNFERWLQRLIICNGVHFWNWGFETSEGYYRNLQSHIDNLNEYHGKNYKLE